MRNATLPLTAALVIGCTPARHPAPPVSSPTVLELFQSQGCSSCPPANANVNSLADRPDVLALSFAVTYWDKLGWKDTFGSPRWTARQWDYARHAGRSEVATPQVIVNGGQALVGNDRGRLDAAIALAGAPKGGPTIVAEGASFRLGAGRGGRPATVWLVRFDPRTIDVPVRAGENEGLTLPHRDIVRELVHLGDWSGRPQRYTIPAMSGRGLSSAILVQQDLGGPIIAAHRI